MVISAFLIYEIHLHLHSVRTHNFLQQPHLLLSFSSWLHQLNMAGIVFSIACMILGYLIEYLVAPIGPTIVEYLLGPIGSVIAYVYHYKRNIRGLREEVEKLRLARERVQHMVSDARRNGEEIESDVKKWLRSVYEIFEEASRAFEAEEDARRRMFLGLCPNFRARYHLSKKVMKTAKIVDELLQEGRFDRVSYTLTPRWKGIAPVDGYEAFESRMSTSKKIMAEFRGASISIIGVYGMGGVGKTTLLKEVGRQAMEDKLFDDVVMATVTQNPNLKKIQGELADRLGLRFEEETIAGRAGHLRERLKKEKRILVLLDDLWAKLDLEKVGIPHGNAHKGCKILLASRSLDVLSSEMDTQKNFALGVLQDREAWDLFKKMAGNSVEDPDLQSTAAEIARGCAGLPVAIVTVARALRNKNSFEWKNASRQLRRPSSRNVRGMQKVIYSTLELSYRQLESEELKSTFLLCGLMTYNASIEDLLKYGIGLGLFQGVYTAEEARDRVYTLVRNLKASCLLVDGSASNSLRMHDVVRDVALSIASRDQQVFVARDEDGLVELPDEETLQKCTAISLQHCDIVELPDRLHCPQLKFFYMGCKNPSLKIPDNFFKGLDAVKVLHVTNTHFPSLPSSFGFLANLQTLCLDQCMLQDVAIIGELKRLVILSFSGSDIEILPRDVRHLTKLKVLDLSNCKKLKVIPSNVISSLYHLEELSMANSFVNWAADPLKSPDANVSVAELNLLPRLVSLDAHIPDAEVLPEDLLFENLTRYRIFIGNGWEWSGDYETESTLKVKLDTNMHLENVLLILLKRTEELYLDGLKGVKNILYELDSEGFPRLKHLHLQNCADIQYISDSREESPCVAFPVLESLFLQNLINLEKIFHGSITTKCFSKLGVVKVEKCDRLKNLCAFSMIGDLFQLQEMKVSECKLMEEIFCDESEADIDSKKATGMINFSHLRSLELEQLPKLKSFCSGRKTLPISELKLHLSMKDTHSKEIISQEAFVLPIPLFNEKIMFPNLEVLRLTSIGSQRIWEDQPLPSSTASLQLISSFQNLTFLRAKGCHNLTYLLSSSTSKSLVNLKRLEVHRCHFIEDIFPMLQEESVDTLLFPQLESISLKRLPNLTRFCYGNSVEFPSLNKLYIKHCPKLEEFIFDPTRRDAIATDDLEGQAMEENYHSAIRPLFSEKVALPSLEVMKISHLHAVRMLWNCHLMESSFSKLKALKVKHCEKLQTIFPANTLRRTKNLESLIVIDCESLEEVFEVQTPSVEETHAAADTRLSRLILSRLPKMEHAWSKDPVGILLFRSLQSVSVFNCLSLKSLFPASVARGLLHLQQLEICSCALEEIVAKERGHKVAARFVFPHITSLRLQDLPDLRSFYPGLHTSEWPSLKTLEITGCYNLVILASDYQRFQEKLTAEQLETSIPQSFFLAEKGNLLHLEELRLEVNGAMREIWDDEFLAEFFRTNSPRLRKLKLSNLSELRCLWKEESHPSLPFRHLESLELSHCGSLKSLVPSSHSFDQLMTLEVSNCEGMINLIAPSTAKSMLQLTRMRIDGCKMMTEIVAGEKEGGEENVDEVVFNKLKCLELDNLPTLACFCSGKQPFSFPYLEKVIVSLCPEMKSFCRGELSTPKLVRVHKTEEEEDNDEWHWEGDLNTTIKHVFIDQVSFFLAVQGGS